MSEISNSINDNIGDPGFDSLSNNWPDTMHIEWVVNNVCNYSCSYCLPELHSGTSGQPNYDSSLKFLDFVHNEINPNHKMLTLSGGEPTQWPRLQEFLKNMHPSYSVTIVSNGSRTIRWWRDFIESSPNVSVITISVHLEFVNLDHIIELCKLLQDKVRVTLLILFKPDKKDMVNDLLSRIEQEDLKIQSTVKPITTREISERTQNEAIEYTNEELDFIKSNTRYKQNPIPLRPIASSVIINGEMKPIFYPAELIAQRKNTFNGWWCEGGSKRLVIWHDGNIYPAQCETAKRNSLGNINDITGNWKIVKGILCKTTYCACLPDIRIPKWKIK